MGYPGRHKIYEATIRRMTLQALDEQKFSFRKAHEEDSDEQLLGYVRTCAFRLRHSPWPGEIAGGSMIEERFGSWERVLQLAKLPPPTTENQLKNFARFQAEAERQKEVYRQRKAEKKKLAQQRMAQQAQKKKHSE